MGTMAAIETGARGWGCILSYEEAWLRPWQWLYLQTVLG
jgi:hypothetical protein